MCQHNNSSLTQATSANTLVSFWPNLNSTPRCRNTLEAIQIIKFSHLQTFGQDGKELVIDQLWLKLSTHIITVIIAFKFAMLANQRSSLPSLNPVISSLWPDMAWFLTEFGTANTLSNNFWYASKVYQWLIRSYYGYCDSNASYSPGSMKLNLGIEWD